MTSDFAPGATPIDLHFDPDEQALLAKAAADTTPTEWLRKAVLRAATWQVAVREIRAAEPAFHHWTAENLPAHLVQMLDKAAGKVHSPGGTVHQTLAELLNTYDAMFWYEEDAEALAAIWDNMLSTVEYTQRCGTCGDPRCTGCGTIGEPAQ